MHGTQRLARIAAPKNRIAGADPLRLIQGNSAPAAQLGGIGFDGGWASRGYVYSSFSTYFASRDEPPLYGSSEHADRPPP
jgi:hypothetical protein